LKKYTVEFDAEEEKKDNKLIIFDEKYSIFIQIKGNKFNIIFLLTKVLSKKM